MHRWIESVLIRGSSELNKSGKEIKGNMMSLLLSSIFWNCGTTTVIDWKWAQMIPGAIWSEKRSELLKTSISCWFTVRQMDVFVRYTQIFTILIQEWRKSKKPWQEEWRLWWDLPDRRKKQKYHWPEVYEALTQWKDKKPKVGLGWGVCLIERQKSTVREIWAHPARVRNCPIQHFIMTYISNAQIAGSKMNVETSVALATHKGIHLNNVISFYHGVKC